MVNTITSKLLIVIILFLDQKGSQGFTLKDEDTRVDCVDNIQDFLLWSSSPQWNYVSGGDSLPGIMRGKLQGDGIWYYEHASNLFILTDLGLYGSTPPVYSSNFLYVKYYTHIHTDLPEKQAIVFPALYPSDGDHYKYLPRTQDFVWGEEVVELNQDLFDEYYGGIAAVKFDEDEYYLVEKIVVAQGFNYSTSTPSAHEIKALCGWEEEYEPSSTTEIPSETSTTTTTTLKPPTTPPSSGFCTEPGIFPDPEECDKFHVCQLDDQGNIWDSEFTCPETTVWCQGTLECETPDVCPCTI